MQMMRLPLGNFEESRLWLSSQAKFKLDKKDQLELAPQQSNIAETFQR